MFTRLLVFSLLIAPIVVKAQTSGTVPPKISTRERAVKLSPAQQNALYVLDSVIDELPKLDRVQERVSLAAAIVKLMSPMRPERCRRMLDSLFNDAIQLKQTDSSGVEDKRPDPDSIVREIIQIAAIFDVKLAQSYIDKYTEDVASSNEPSAVSKQTTRTAALYLKLASELIEKEPTKAMSIASKSLSAAIMPETLVFLGKLRKRDAALADNFFTAALRSTKMRRGNDVNELLFLYSYIFTPLRVPIVTSKGLGTYALYDYLDVAESYSVNPVLARQYIDIVEQSLLDSTRYRGDIQPPVFGAAGDFYLISLIEPQVAVYASAMSQSLQQQKNFLLNFLEPDQRVKSQASTDKWNNIPDKVSLTSAKNVETADYLLQQAEQATDPNRKDQLFYAAAAAAARAKQYDKALEIIGRVSSKYHDEASQSITFHIAIMAADNNQFEKAEELARRDGDLVRRSYILTLIADSMLKGKIKNFARASQLLDEVQQLTQKLDKLQDKFSVLFGIATVYSRFNAGRASDLLREAIDVANKVNDFAGDTYVGRNLDIGGFKFFYSMYEDTFTFNDAIYRMGNNNFDATLQDIRTIKNRFPRLKATVALCNGILSKKAPGTHGSL